MNEDLVISSLEKVYDGELKAGKQPYKCQGREYDGFVYYIYGETSYVMDSYSFVAQSGDVIYLAKDSKYEMKILKDGKYICLDFLFNDKSARASEIYKSFPESIKNEFQKSLYLWLNKSFWNKAEVYSCIYKIYSNCLKSKKMLYSKGGESFYKALDYVTENYCNPDFNIAKLSEFAGISQIHLRRLFKNELKMSPVKYVNYLRIEKAKALLANTNCSIREISLLTGIQDSYYFSRLFKKEIGIPPREYRKKANT